MSTRLESRKFIIAGIFLVVGLIFVIRLMKVQLFSDEYKMYAQNNSIRKITQYPARGVIFDRDGELLVTNEAAYDLMVVPKQVEGIDTLAFCALMEIDKETFDKKIASAAKYGRNRPSPFLKEISAKQYARVQDQLFKYTGFYIQTRTLRYYPNDCAPHLLGYIGEVSARFLELDTTDYYRSGDYTGLNGIERSYEKQLRGERGVKNILVDVHNNEKGAYLDGKLDTAGVSGYDLVCTISVELQQYAEKLMQNKRGSVVAIEPKTGEILTLVSAPAYDPNLLVGRERAKNFVGLQNNDSLRPLFNRAQQAQYPPGSIFKLVQALIALEEGAITPETGFACNKSLVGCHNHGAASSVQRAIQFSCNPYFYRVYQRLLDRNLDKNMYEDCALSLDRWKEHVESFGFGKNITLDLPNSKRGNIPGREYFDKRYGRHRWLFQTIYSLSIGQGEVETVPVQMANLAAIIANEGYYVSPHVVRSFGKDGVYTPIPFEKNYTTVDKKFYPLVKEGMRAVVEEPGGTARRARIDSVTVCGKTGTAQNPHGEDHSVFIAFAPKDNPQIAVAVYVENAGFGGTWAAPIASLVIERYLTGKVNELKEKRILEANLLNVE